MSSGGQKAFGGSKGSGHAKDKKPVTPRRGPGSNDAPADNTAAPAPAPAEFIVEKFTGKRYVNGKVLMQVKWKGFPSEMNTWEPYENLTNCVLLLGEFEAEHFKNLEMANRSSASPASSCGKKKPSSTKASPANQPMSNGTKSPRVSTPKPRAGHQIGENQKEKPVPPMGPKTNGTKSPRVSTPKPRADHQIGENHKEKPIPPMGPKTNGTKSPRVSTPKNRAGHKIGGNHEKNPVPLPLSVAKSPVKLHQAKHSQLSESSDDETPLCSFGKRASSPPATVPPPISDSLKDDLDLSSDGSTSLHNRSLESSMSFGSDSLPLSVLAASSANKGVLPSVNSPKALAGQWQVGKNVSNGALVITRKEPSTPTKTVVIEISAASNSATPVDRATKSIHSMTIADRDPKVQSSARGRPKKGGKKSLKEDKKMVPKKDQKIKSGDEDFDGFLKPQTPRTAKGAACGNFFNWKLPPVTTPFGLARGLELDKVVHHYRARDRLFLFCTWKGLDVQDAVPLEDLREAYPAKLIEYFENMKRRFK